MTPWQSMRAIWACRNARPVRRTSLRLKLAGDGIAYVGRAARRSCARRALVEAGCQRLPESEATERRVKELLDEKAAALDAAAEETAAALQAAAREKAVALQAAADEKAAALQAASDEKLAAALQAAADEEASAAALQAAAKAARY